MAETSAIEWTDATFNPWWGCSRVSPACRFCYADTTATRWGMELWRRNGMRREMSEGYWRAPLSWNRKAANAGVPLKVFCASMADVFEDHPQVVEWRKRLFGLIEQTPWLTWQLLTKRPENVADMVPWAGAWPRNVWLGTSVENQRFADERLPILTGLTGPAVRFLSCEPLLGEVDLAPWLVSWNRAVRHSTDNPTHILGPYEDGLDHIDCGSCDFDTQRGGISWVITGGESGPKARVTHPSWFRILRDQCEDLGVAFLFKQFGEYSPDMPTIADPSRPDGTAPDWDRKPAAWVCAETGKTVRTEAEVPDVGNWQAMWRPGKKAAGRLLDGHDWRQFPPIWTPDALAAVA